MRGHLSRIRNWDELADDVSYSVKALASHTGRSVRQLERFFVKTTGRTPHEYFREIRMRRAVELLKDGSRIKEVAMILRYKQISHFSKDFRSTFGFPPSRLSEGLQRVGGEKSHLDNNCRD